jgi:hypothetical protein
MFENLDDGKMLRMVLEHEIGERVVVLATVRLPSLSLSESQKSVIATTRTTAKLSTSIHGTLRSYQLQLCVDRDSNFLDRYYKHLLLVPRVMYYTPSSRLSPSSDSHEHLTQHVRRWGLQYYQTDKKGDQGNLSSHDNVEWERAWKNLCIALGRCDENWAM